MPNFCVNTKAQSKGDHEVHDLATTKGCLPAPYNQESLGFHSSCDGAVAEAKRRGYRADGCARCCPSCHSS